MTATYTYAYKVSITNPTVILATKKFLRTMNFPLYNYSYKYHISFLSVYSRKPFRAKRKYLKIYSWNTKIYLSQGETLSHGEMSFRPHINKFPNIFFTLTLSDAFALRNPFGCINQILLWIRTNKRFTWPNKSTEFLHRIDQKFVRWTKNSVHTSD